MNQVTHDNSGNRNRLVPGLILIGLGLVALFGNLGVSIFGNIFGALIFGGLAYYVYRNGVRTGRQGMRLLAIPLAGLAIVSLLPGPATGALFLALIGLAFAVVWRTDAQRWWAVIPAGAFASLAATAGLSNLPGNVSGFVFLGGLAATFYALTRLNVKPQSWAIYPAGALAAVAVIALVGGGGSWLFPLLLVAAGVVLLARSGVIQIGDLGGILKGKGAAASKVEAPGQAPVQVVESAIVTAAEATSEAATEATTEAPSAAATELSEWEADSDTQR